MGVGGVGVGAGLGAGPPGHGQTALPHLGHGMPPGHSSGGEA